jgi:HD-GYP domain-containing protein (c-di-GMP phosphodiesterase class II)
MTIADIFTAMTEERPYRQCEPKDNLIAMMRNMCEEGKLDEEILEILIENYDEVFEARRAFQNEAMDEFNEFRNNIFSNRVCQQNNNFINVLNA